MIFILYILNYVVLNCDNFQGKCEIQGDYNTVMKSGVDLMSILKNDENNEDNNCTDIEKIAKFNGMNVMRMDNPELTFASESEKNGIEDNRNSSREEIGLLRELESSSKGKVKGSLLMHYFNSANRPCTLIFIITTFLLAQIFASVADVWVSYWYAFKLLACSYSFRHIQFILMIISLLKGFGKKNIDIIICNRKCITRYTNIITKIHQILIRIH